MLMPAFSTSLGYLILTTKNEIQAFGVARTDTAGSDTFQTRRSGLVALERASIDEDMGSTVPLAAPLCVFACRLDILLMAYQYAACLSQTSAFAHHDLKDA